MSLFFILITTLLILILSFNIDIMADLKSSFSPLLERLATLPQHVKLTTLGVSVGVALFGVLAVFFQVSSLVDE